MSRDPVADDPLCMRHTSRFLYDRRSRPCPALVNNTRSSVIVTETDHADLGFGRSNLVGSVMGECVCHDPERGKDGSLLENNSCKFPGFVVGMGGLSVSCGILIRAGSPVSPVSPASPGERFQRGPHVSDTCYLRKNKPKLPYW